MPQIFPRPIRVRHEQAVADALRAAMESGRDVMAKQYGVLITSMN